LAIALAALALASCGSRNGSSNNRELTVFAAASLREALEEIGRAYRQRTGTEIVYNFAGSNELARQIVASPGADLFFSAAENWMDTVEHAGRSVDGSRRDLLSNALVVVASSSSSFALASPCDLATLDVKNISLADPEAVPAGRYAKKWLESLDCGDLAMWKYLAPKVAPAPDVRAALGLVLADPRIVGIVYRTDQLAFAGRTKVLYEVKDGPPIRYVVARLAGGRGGDEAREFETYLESPEARSVFERHGFIVTATVPGAAK
jgi:molybdate transport system substrate-binding protein